MRSDLQPRNITSHVGSGEAAISSPWPTRFPSLVAQKEDGGLRQMSVPPPMFDQPVPTRRKLMTPRDRFFWWYSLTLLFLGPFGFVVGPLMAQRASRKAALRYPVEARLAQARDTGFAWWQWWAMTALTLMGAFGAFAVLSGLPAFLFVMRAKLVQ